ncbi:MAG: hypothetical protein ACI4ML_09340 [Aristaeellaceae bacterium]
MRQQDCMHQGWNSRPEPCRPLCPPEACRCAGCSQPPRGLCGQERKQGFLLPRILASGRTWLRCCQTTLRVEGLPECAPPPLTLLSVCVAGEPAWTQEHDPARRALCLHVSIPLICQVQDGCGCSHTGRACAQVDVMLRLTMPAAECWRNTLLVQPCVRLVCVPCPSEDGCFQAELEILAEAFMIRWEPCMAGPPRPECPPSLPLYPQPPCME